MTQFLLRNVSAWYSTCPVYLHKQVDDLLKVLCWFVTAVPTHSGAELRSFRNASAIAALQDEAQLTLNSYIHTRYDTRS